MPGNKLDYTRIRLTLRTRLVSNGSLIIWKPSLLLILKSDILVTVSVIDGLDLISDKCQMRPEKSLIN